jgi:ATP-binding cassette subfamily B protein
MRPYLWQLIGLFLLSLIVTPLALLTPMPLKMAVDNIIGGQPLPAAVDTLLPAAISRSDRGLLVFTVLLLAGVMLVNQVREFASSLLTAYTGERMLRDFRAKLFYHVQRLSFSYHDQIGTADSIYRIQNDASSLQNVVISGVVPLFTSTFTLVSMIYVTARINFKFAVVGLTILPFVMMVSRFYRRQLRIRTRAIKKLESSALSVVQEVLAAIRVVKAFGQEDREGERFVQRSSESVRERVRAASAEGGFALLVALTTAVGTGAVLFVGVRHVLSGVLTLGELLLVMSYLAQLYKPLDTLSKGSTILQSSLASAERAFSLLDEAQDVVEGPDARPLSRASGAVTFREVSFAYREGERPVLRDVSFEVEPGTRVGISGATGAGKSTLMNLLTRFYDPTAGRIELDGVDLRDYRIADLRNQFAIVLQEPVLFSTSVAENIAYARPEAGHEEIVAAAQAAGAHGFIECLPEGYETKVGERGMSLSGGERQRISLARAFLKDAPILILDEPTSAVDTKTEATIMEAMERLIRGRTAFMIAHRLGTLANCDLRLEVEDGRVIRTEQRHTLAALANDKSTAEPLCRSKETP